MGFIRQFTSSMTLAAVLTGLTAAVYAQENPRGREEPGTGADPRVTTGQIAPLLEGLGDHHFPITTDSERAQRFFNQGLALAYAFNHAEAERAFRECARLDPDCAMAYWGRAFVLGPNINQPMPPEAVPVAFESIQQAQARKAEATRKERDMIEALATRYAPEPSGDRASLDGAYAAAMATLHSKYPDDDDIATMYAAAIMNTIPWSYYGRDGTPREETKPAVAALETVVARNPNHAGAHHYYIHISEEYYPDRAIDSADRLGELMPGAGHIVHMPSHIYMRVGRYADGYESNRKAILADEGYITQCRQQGIYPLSYYPHNVHFLAWGAQKLGRSREAIEAARKVGKKALEAHAGSGFGLYESFAVMPIYMLARFGEWDAILNEKQPPEDAPYANGIWHYARGLAYNFKDDPEMAAQELDTLRTLRDAANDNPELLVGFAQAGTLLDIAAEILAAELAVSNDDYDEAVSRLDRAVRLEDGLVYNEPPDWYYPVRHTLGAVLLEAQRPKEAEIIYWADLRDHPENGWALFGLMEALEAQGRKAEAAAIEKRFRKAWSTADIDLNSSRF